MALVDTRFVTSPVDFEYRKYICYFFSLLYCTSLFASAFLTVLFLPLVTNCALCLLRGRAADCSRHRRPPIANIREITHNKSGMFSRTWGSSAESLILRQFNLALPLTFDDLRIAGITRRRLVKVARVREYGRNV